MNKIFWKGIVLSLFMNILLISGAGVAGAAGTAGLCEEGSIPRCVIEHYNDGSRVEVFTEVEGGRVEWRFTGKDQRLSNVFFYPGDGTTMELELNPDTSAPQTALVYTQDGRLLSWSTYDPATQAWTKVPVSSSSHTLKQFVDPQRRLLKKTDCPRRDLKRCTLTRNEDGSSTEKLFYPNGKVWEENVFKTANRMDFEFTWFDFWGRERMHKVYDRESGHLKTAYWFDAKNKQVLRYIYDLNTGKETSNVIYNQDRRVLRWEQTGPDGLIAESVSFNLDGTPHTRSLFTAGKLTQQTVFAQGGLPLTRVHYNDQREMQVKETYDAYGNLQKVECFSGPCKQPGYTIRPARTGRSVCQASAEEPQCQEASFQTKQMSVPESN